MKLALTTLATAALMACAASAAPQKDAAPTPGAPASADCFSVDRIHEQKIADRQTIYFDVEQRGVYRLTMANGCLTSATPSDPLGIQSTGGGRICKPNDVDISVRGRRCLVGEIARLSPAEADALPPKHRP